MSQQLNQDTLLVIASFGLALKTLANECSRPTGDFIGVEVDALVGLAIHRAEEMLKNKPEMELRIALEELAQALDVDFIREVPEQ